MIFDLLWLDGHSLIALRLQPSVAPAWRSSSSPVQLADA